MGWRYIDSGIADPYFVTAADEAISIALKNKKIIRNTIHFYQRNKPTISVGRFRNIRDDVNLEKCKKYDVKIIRRTSGGGSIFTDKNCLIYSLIFNVLDTKLKSSQDIFKNICGCITKSFKKFGMNSEYKYPNDILLNNKKISGSAQIKKENITLIHGSILWDTDLAIMKEVLKNNNKKKVTTIKNEMAFTPSIFDIKHELISGFEMYFNVDFKKSSFSNYERNTINKLLKDRYKKDEWNFLR